VYAQSSAPVQKSIPEVSECVDKEEEEGARNRKTRKKREGRRMQRINHEPPVVYAQLYVKSPNM
jgi:hypothetical protein